MLACWRHDGHNEQICFSRPVTILASTTLGTPYLPRVLHLFRHFLVIKNDFMIWSGQIFIKWIFLNLFKNIASSVDWWQNCCFTWKSCECCCNVITMLFSVITCSTFLASTHWYSTTLFRYLYKLRQCLYSSLTFLLYHIETVLLFSVWIVFDRLRFICICRVSLSVLKRNPCWWPPSSLNSVRWHLNNV